MDLNTGRGDEIPGATGPLAMPTSGCFHRFPEDHPARLEECHTHEAKAKGRLYWEQRPPLQDRAGPWQGCRDQSPSDT